MSSHEHISHRGSAEISDTDAHLSPAFAALIQHIQQQTAGRICYFPDTQRRLCVQDKLCIKYINACMPSAWSADSTQLLAPHVQMDQWSDCEQVVAPLLSMQDIDLNIFFEGVERVLSQGGWLLAAWVIKGSFAELAAHDLVSGDFFVSMDALLSALQRTRCEKPVIDCDRYRLDYACLADAMHDHAVLQRLPVGGVPEKIESKQESISCLLEIATLAVHIRPQARQSMQAIGVQVQQSGLRTGHGEHRA